MTERDLRWLIDFNKDSEGNIVIPAKVAEELLFEIEAIRAADELIRLSEEMGLYTDQNSA